ncbi:MAG: helix-turn-helix domain-containing protein, partial [Candidatus Omnitrophota bacterium]
MGTVYKLKPEIKAFILEKKKENLALSCRKVTQLIEEQFKNKISKSTINAIFKESGLSMPVGRRPKKRRRPSLKLQIALPTLEPTEKLIQIAQPETKIGLPGPIQVTGQSTGEITNVSLRATEGSEAIPTEIASSPCPPEAGEAPRNDTLAPPPFTDVLPTQPELPVEPAQPEPFVPEQVKETPAPE